MAVPAYEENDAVPVVASAMSSRLAGRISAAGLACLQPLLEQQGVLTSGCLAALSQEELDELRARVRAAGFGVGHVRALQELSRQAQEEQEEGGDKADRLDEAPVSTSRISPKLYFRLLRRGLQNLEPLLVHCGVQSVSSLRSLSPGEREEVSSALAAAGSNPGPALWELADEAAPPRFLGEPTRLPSEPELTQAEGELPFEATLSVASAANVEASNADSNQRGAKRSRQAAFGSGSTEEAAPSAAMRKRGGDSSKKPKLAPVVRRFSSSTLLRQMSRTEEGVPDACRLGCSRARISRASLDDVLFHLKAAPAELVRFRDRASGKQVEARVPAAVLALLRLKASCSGKTVSEERLARLAMDVMEEQGYDPVRAVASLEPSALQCPASATRLLGSGSIGVVFLVEETGTAVKVMLEDFAEQEYAIFCAFADAGLAPRPIGLEGPQIVPAGQLYSIHMEAIQHTLSGILQHKAPSGPRRGLVPVTEVQAQRIGEAVVRALQRMWDNGLVHGDLHLQNIALKDPYAQPLVQLLDFGRSARNAAAAQSGSAEALRAGHEYDVFRLLLELCESYDGICARKAAELKECEKEIRELRRGCPAAALLSSRALQAKPGQQLKTVEAAAVTECQLHDARQIAGLQAYTQEEPGVLRGLETSYNVILGLVLLYARDKLDFTFEGVASLGNRRMRQAITKRQKLCFNAYFKSDLFWGV